MNEITYSFNVLLKNGSLGDQFASSSKSADQAAANLVRNVQNIGTGVGGTALALGGVATPGFAIFQNLDPVPPGNYVEIGSFSGGTFYPFLKLKAGEMEMARVGVAAPYARANTAAVNLFYIIYND
jgi:hypothetical protein